MKSRLLYGLLLSSVLCMQGIYGVEAIPEKDLQKATKDFKEYTEPVAQDQNEIRKLQAEKQQALERYKVRFEELNGEYEKQGGLDKPEYDEQKRLADIVPQYEFMVEDLGWVLSADGGAAARIEAGKKLAEAAAVLNGRGDLQPTAQEIASKVKEQVEKLTADLAQGRTETGGGTTAPDAPVKSGAEAVNLARESTRRADTALEKINATQSDPEAALAAKEFMEALKQETMNIDKGSKENNLPAGVAAQARNTMSSNAGRVVGAWMERITTGLQAAVDAVGVAVSDARLRFDILVNGSGLKASRETVNALARTVSQKFGSTDRPNGPRKSMAELGANVVDWEVLPERSITNPVLVGTETKKSKAIISMQDHIQAIDACSARIDDLLRVLMPGSIDYKEALAQKTDLAEIKANLEEAVATLDKNVAVIAGYLKSTTAGTGSQG